MATINKRNGKYCVIYYYVDTKGKKRQKWETFDSISEAKARKSIVEAEKAKGSFIPPNTDTVESFLDTFIELYGYQNWSVSTLTRNRSTIKYYILPYIGKKKLQDIKPIVIEKYYRDLKEQRVIRPMRSNTDGKVTSYILKSVHKLLSCAFGCAEKWELIASNPFKKVTPPKHEYAKKEIWTSEMISRALEVCEDPKVSLAIQLSFACSLRIGEVLGLQWKNVFISDEDIENDNAHIVVEQQLQRLSKKGIDELNVQDILYTFPSATDNESNTTVLVLRKPKTQSSIRTIWLPNTLVKFLREWKEQQNEYKEFFQDEYHDYDMVLCFEDGRPVEHNIIRKGLAKVSEKAGLPPVVFHSLRHSSTTYKLKLNHGDIKATQGDTGHAQADMVTDLYKSIPTCVLVFKKCKTHDDIFFIDASKEFESGKNQNRLTDANIQKIMETYLARKDVDKYAHCASLEEIAENDYNLNIPRYVDTFEEEEEIDIHAVMKEIKELEAKRDELDKEIDVYLKELGLLED